MTGDTYSYAVDGAGGDDRGGNGLLADVQEVARGIIDVGKSEMAAWKGQGPMRFPVTRLRYDEENEWAAVGLTEGPGRETDFKECPGRESAVQHLTALLTGRRRSA